MAPICVRQPYHQQDQSAGQQRFGQLQPNRGDRGLSNRRFTNTNTDTNCHAHTNADSYIDANCHAHTNGDSYINANCHAHTNGDSYTNTHADSNPKTCGTEQPYSYCSIVDSG
jgi:hypothetical protein